MSLLATLDSAKAIMGTVTGQVTTQATINNALVLQNLRVVTGRVNAQFRPSAPPFWPLFEPTIGQRTYLLTAQNVNTGLNLFRFPDALLELTSVSINTTTLTVPATVTTFPTTTQPPYYQLQLADWTNTWGYYLFGLNTWTPMITIGGVWGFNTDYANAWPVLTTLAAAVLTPTVTSITVTNVDAPDMWGQIPAISAGNLLKIESEYLEVLSTDIATNICTVRRGVNGSTAAAHANGLDVAVWQVEPSVQRAVARQAGLLYRRFGAYTTNEIQPNGAEIRYPNDWLQEVQATMQAYVYN